MKSEKKKFPIQNDAACLYKWTWSTIFLNRGTTSSCHRGKHWEFDVDTMKNFHNHPGKLEDRRKMKEGIWPGNGCEYCRDVEAAGGKSDRTSFVNDSVEIMPMELEIDPEAIETTPRLLEVYFTNVCNNACVYCSPGFSSLIEQENRMYGPSKYNWDYSNWPSDSRDKYPEYVAKFWEWMHENSNYLLIFQTLGGEPMYQKEFDDCLEFWDKHPNPDLTWRIFSNLHHEPEKYKEKLLKVTKLVDEGKIKNMDIVTSIDCWGPELEYARYGTTLEEAEKNIITMLETRGVGILLHSTLTALTILSLDKLIEKAIEWRKIKNFSFNWNTVVRPPIFNPYIFGDKLVPWVDKAVAVMEQHGTVFEKEIAHLTGIKQQMIATPIDVKNIKKFVGYMDEIDFRRKLDWRKVYPDIDRIVKEIIGNEGVEDVQLG